MKWLKQFVMLMSLLLVVAVSLAAGQIGVHDEARLGERALAQIVGQSDTAAANTSACATASLGAGQVLWNNCPNQPLGPDCIRCLNDRMTKIDNTSGGPGIYNTGPLAVCANMTKALGHCVNGACTNQVAAGKCADTNPPIYDYQD